MAGPVAHIVCALSILQSGFLPDISDHKAFILGTSFPDIRYYHTEVKREQTHVANITWEQVQKEKDPFKAGLLLHSLVDRIREEYLEANNGYKTIPFMPLRSQLMKVCEDTAMYDYVHNWPEVCSYFDTVHGLEFTYNIPKQELINWHLILQNYLKQQPNMQTIIQLFRSTVFNEKLGNFGQSIIPTVALYPRFVAFILQRNNQFIDLMKNFYLNAAGYLSGAIPLNHQIEAVA